MVYKLKEINVNELNTYTHTFKLTEKCVLHHLPHRSPSFWGNQSPELNSLYIFFLFFIKMQTFILSFIYSIFGRYELSAAKVLYFTANDN